MHKKKGFVVRIGDWFYGEKLSYSKYMKSEMMLEELTEKELTDITSEFKNLLHQIDFFPAPTEDEIMMHLSKKINLFTVDKFIYRKEGELHLA